MKKQRMPLLVVLTCLFLAFVFGFFLGRNQTGRSVVVSVPPAMQTEPAQTTVPESEPAETAPPITFPIAINTASKEAFMALPGIGEVLADRILAYREENGAFSAVEGLMNVEGIGEKKMEAILDLIILGG